MAVLQAKRIQGALKKARNVGRVEDTVTIDECTIVLQSLGQDEYEAIFDECQELEEVKYLHAFQEGHVCRSIIQVGDVDLREVEFIEDEVEDPKTGKTTPVKFERHQWLRDNVLATWSREAITVAWRKFAELLVQADEVAKAGIQFKVPDESPEDKLRRLLSELKDAEEEVPAALVERTYSDFGLMRKSSPEELAEVERRTREFAEEQAKKRAEAEQAQEPAPTQEEDVEEPDFEPDLPQAPPPPPPRGSRTEPQGNPDDLMRRRRPMNQEASRMPIPVPSATQTPPTRPKVEVPAEIRAAAINSRQLGSNRAAEIAAMEAGEELGEDQPELRKVERQDRAAVANLIDRPPPVGINPRFRRPPR